MAFHGAKGARVIDQLVAFVAFELTLFAAIGFLIGGIDDFLVDSVWIVRSVWRRLTIYRRHDRVDATSLAQPSKPGPIIVFIAAWDEAAVIGRMIDYAVRTFDHRDYRIYVGCYPNDCATIAAIDALGLRQVRVVVGDAGIM